MLCLRIVFCFWKFHLCGFFCGTVGKTHRFVDSQCLHMYMVCFIERYHYQLFLLCVYLKLLMLNLCLLNRRCLLDIGKSLFNWQKSKTCPNKEPRWGGGVFWSEIPLGLDISYFIYNLSNPCIISLELFF